MPQCDVFKMGTFRGRQVAEVFEVAGQGCGVVIVHVGDDPGFNGRVSEGHEGANGPIGSR